MTGWASPQARLGSLIELHLKLEPNFFFLSWLGHNPTKLPSLSLSPSLLNQAQPSSIKLNKVKAQLSSSFDLPELFLAYLGLLFMNSSNMQGIIHE
jgi:hypothetical protein